MYKKSRLVNKGPRPTAQDARDHKERTTLRQQQEAQDRAELEEYTKLLRSGDPVGALEIARRRQSRSRVSYVGNGQAGAQNSPSGRDTDTGASPALPQQDGAA